MNKKFDLWMKSIDNHYLEEAAMVPQPQEKNYYRFVVPAVAACLVLVVSGLLLRHTALPDSSPDSGKNVAEQLPTTTVPDVTPEDGITKEYFTKDNTDYTILSCEASAPTAISVMSEAETEPLTWYAGGLEIKLCSTNDTIWASWFDSNTSTQWCLLSDTSSLALLTTAKDIVKELGYSVAVAPEQATDVTYDAFRLNDLVVAETTFVLDDNRHRFRMSATPDVSADFADISGLGNHFDTFLTSTVGWCPAKIYYNENGSGKIIWFDIVPGLLYSLSMERNASEEALLSLAHELFVPAQDNADW